MRGLAQIDPLATTVWRWLYDYDVVEAAQTNTINHDKRGIRSSYPDDTPARQRAWDMWHELFTTEEEAGGLRGLRKGYDRFFGQFQPQADTSVTEVAIDKASGFWVEPAGISRSRVVLHLHGGGLAFGSAACSTEYAERLARSVDGRCLALEYRLAPENPYPCALDDTVTAYRWLLSKGYRPEDILLSGESAGGGLAVAAAMRLRDMNVAQPAGIMVLSPLADNSLKSESIDARAGQDPIVDRDILTFMASGYFQGERADAPYVSPIYGDFSGLPPLLIQAAEDEVLVDDAKRLAAAAKRGGVKVSLRLYRERMHIFSLFPFLETAKEAIRDIAEFAQVDLGQDANAG